MATPTLANSPALLYALKPDTNMWWLVRLELNRFAPRFYNHRADAEKLVARYQKMLASREARSHEETT